VLRIHDTFSARVAGSGSSARASGSRRAPLGFVWGMLLLRSALALLLQSVVALGFLLAGSAAPWRAAADWWLAWLTVVNLVCIALLSKLMGQEGLRFRDLLAPSKEERGKDLRWVALALVVGAPLALVPNVTLGNALWGSAGVGASLSFRPLPPPGALLLLAVFPLTQGLAELPVYFGYVMPRLSVRTGRPRLAWFAAAAALAAQHVFLPLLFDWRFVVWRLLMFAPFALWLGFVLRRRSTALPYLAFAHGLLDASLPLLVLRAVNG